jgi:cytochrome oxidase Cu insertion factor (SCO1/SenC/PrrC family)
MRTLPHGVTLFLIGAASMGCIANNANTTRSTSHKPANAAKTAQRAAVAAKTAPEIAGVDADGNTFHLSDYRGRVVLLDFWASW